MSDRLIPIEELLADPVIVAVADAYVRTEWVSTDPLYYSLAEKMSEVEKDTGSVTPSSRLGSFSSAQNSSSRCPAPSRAPRRAFVADQQEAAREQQTKQNEVAQAGPPKRREIQDLLTSPSTIKVMSALAPKHLTPERMARLAVAAVTRTPKLGLCHPVTLLGAFLECTALGLEPNSPLQHVHLLPFWNSRMNKGEGGYEITRIIGYRGFIELGARSGKQIWPHGDVVYPSDFFDFSYGSAPFLKHKVGLRNTEGETPQYAYCHVALSDGQAFVVLPWSEVLKHRDASHSWRTKPNESPWTTWPDRMARKTAIRSLYGGGEVQTSTEIQMAVNIDDQPMDYQALAQANAEQIREALDTFIVPSDRLAAPSGKAEAQQERSGGNGWGQQYTVRPSTTTTVEPEPQEEREEQPEPEQGQQEESQGEKERSEPAQQPAQIRQARGDRSGRGAPQEPQQRESTAPAQDGGAPPAGRRSRRSAEPVIVMGQEYRNLGSAMTRIAKEVENAPLDVLVAEQENFTKVLVALDQAGFEGAEPTKRLLEEKISEGPEPVMTVLGHRCATYDDVVTFVDEELRRHEEKGIGPEHMEDSVYDGLGAAIDTLIKERPDAGARLNVRLDAYSAQEVEQTEPQESGEAQQTDGAAQPAGPPREKFPLRNGRRDDLGSHEAREFLEKLGKLIDEVDPRDPERARKVAQIRLANIDPLELLQKVHDDKELLEQAKLLERRLAPPLRTDPGAMP